MRLERKGGMLEQLVESAREEVVRRFNDGIREGIMPDEVTIVSETRSFLVIGSPESREKARKEWIKQLGKGMPPEALKRLKNTGASHQVKIVDKGMQVHVMHEITDIHLTQEAMEKIRKAEKDVQQGVDSGQTGQGSGAQASEQ